MREDLITLLENFDGGDMTADQVMEHIRREMLYPDRIKTMQERYVYDPITNRLFNRETGKRIDAKTVHTSYGQSPVSYNRAVWIVTTGREPRLLGRDRGGLWAKFGDEKIYHPHDRRVSLT